MRWPRLWRACLQLSNVRTNVIMKGSPYFKDYFTYVGDSESPAAFHRWTAISIASALLDRRVYLPFGHSKIYPNMYIVLTGTPGTRKGTALRIGTKLLESLDYPYFAPSKTSKESMWAHMAKTSHMSDSTPLEELDLSDIKMGPPESSPIYIAQDEFTDFLGNNAEDFLTNLTNLWDNLSKYDNPKTSKASVYVHNPTIHMLTGTTPSALGEHMGARTISGGFTSRVLFIHAQPTGTLIPFPDIPCSEAQKTIYGHLKRVSKMAGPIHLSPEVKQLLAKIYTKTPRVMDTRFAYYNQRRYTHLLKLVIVISALNGTYRPTIAMVREANTLLHIAELHMPDALGEFGMAKNSGVANKVMEFIKDAGEEMPTLQRIHTHVSRDIASLSDLVMVLKDLFDAGRIVRDKVVIDGRMQEVYLNNLDTESIEWPKGTIDYSVLFPEESPGLIQSEDM